MEGGDEGLDDQFVALGDAGIGATIMGRNMFGPIRGPWADDDWKGWWGDNPPYHHPVFVLTHHPRPSIPDARRDHVPFRRRRHQRGSRARARRRGGEDVRIGGGACTVQEFLRAGLIDDMHLAIVPVLLGRGERLFDNLDGGPEGYECVELVSSPSVAHVRLSRVPA